MATSAIRRISANEVSHAIITAAMRVHSELGPGLLESTYTACLQHQLHEGGVQSATQVGLPVVYHGVRSNLDIGWICWSRSWLSWKSSQSTLYRRYIRPSYFR